MIVLQKPPCVDNIFRREKLMVIRVVQKSGKGRDLYIAALLLLRNAERIPETRIVC